MKNSITHGICYEELNLSDVYLKDRIDVGTHIGSVFCWRWSSLAGEA